jgi:hypothetical protein
LLTLEAASEAISEMHSDWERDAAFLDGGARKIAFREIDDDGKNYSVRLAGMTLWDEHLPSLKMAELSAEEPLAMGFADVHIVDDDTGRMVE